MFKKFLAIFLVAVVLTTPFATFVSAEEAGTFAIEKDEKPGYNNWCDKAMPVASDFTISGSLTTEDYADYYSIEAKNDSLMNFYVSFPEGFDIDLWVMNSSGTNIASSTSADNSYELVSGLEVTEGAVYYFMVTIVDGTGICNYSLRVKEYPAEYTYYTQRPASINVQTGYVSSPENSVYNIGQMHNLYNNAGTYELTNYSWYWNMYKYGCVACSYAMILKNLNKTADCSLTANGFPDILNTTYGQDVAILSKYNSNGTPNKIDATPYSVMWCIADYPSISYSSGKYEADTSIDMTYMVDNAPQRVSNLFNATFTSYDATTASDGASLSDTDKKNMIANLLSEHPEGICLYFYNSSMQWHMIVVTATTHEAPQRTVEYRISSQTIPATYSSALSFEQGIESSPTPSLFPIEKNSAITDEMIERYHLAITSGVQSTIDDGDLFTVYDPVPSIYGYEPTTLDNCFTGVNNATWNDLKYIHVID